MPNIFTLTCPNCGGKLEITEDINRFACGHCGVEHIVQRQGGTVSLSPVIQQLERIGVGTDRTATELTLARLSAEAVQIRAALNEKELSLGGTKEFLSWIFIGGAWVILFGIVFFFNGLTDANISYIFLGAVIGLAGAGLMYWSKREKNQPAVIKKEIDNLQKLLNEKINEIEYYRNLVKH